MKRLAQFGLSGSKLLGKSVLDLGSYTGGMLLQLSNLGIERGLGIEYDQEKVTLAREIAAMSDLGQLEFRQGDIDSLDVADLGTFDAVFCLAIEAHVNDPERLYRLLGQVTNERLYFEGNSNCDVDHTAKQLRAAGFSDITNKGFSTDDANPANHNRPVLIATKRPTGAK